MPKDGTLTGDAPTRADISQTSGVRTPERLDRALSVTTPKTWLLLSALIALLAAVITWSVVGEVATYVRADGIFLSRDGLVLDIVSTSGGTLDRILPEVGDVLAVGDLVAEISDPAEVERRRSAVAAAGERLQFLRAQEAAAQEENALFEQNLREQRERLEALAEAGREILENARARVSNMEGLAAQGIISQVELEASGRTLDDAQRSLFDVMRRRDQLEADELQRRGLQNASLADARSQHLEAQRRVNEIEAVIDTWRIRATEAGRVTEIKSQLGASLAPGEPVLSIETGAEGMDVLIYVSPADGKRVAPGMPVLVSPGTARRETYGAMNGTVQDLSEFPASPGGMAAVLRNQDLAESFSQNGPPYPGRVALTPNPLSVSGFDWTSQRGEELAITPGTLASVEIRVANEPPIALVLPWFRQVAGL